MIMRCGRHPLQLHRCAHQLRVTNHTASSRFVYRPQKSSATDSGVIVALPWSPPVPLTCDHAGAWAVAAQHVMLVRAHCLAKVRLGGAHAAHARTNPHLDTSPRPAR
jgi:hypothetical protein